MASCVVAAALLHPSKPAQHDKDRDAKDPLTTKRTGLFAIRLRLSEVPRMHIKPAFEAASANNRSVDLLRIFFAAQEFPYSCFAFADRPLSSFRNDPGFFSFPAALPASSSSN